MLFGHLRSIALLGISIILTAGVANASVPVGARVTLHATADGTPAPTFQWKKDGANLIGATGATFVIPYATPADSGIYRVTASNIAGTADSADEIFVVGGDPNAPLAGPAFTLQPVASLTVGVGGSATLSAFASGTPAPRYQWLKNEMMIAGATQSTFTLPSATTADEGYYEVVASNLEGTVRSSASLVTVNAPMAPMTAPPAFTLQPVASLSVWAGGSATLSASASGTPAPSYQWLKNGGLIAGATRSTFTLSSATTSGQGYYEVVASNSEGTVRSSACLVSVNVPVAPMAGPAFTLQPVASLSVGVGGSATLSASASGNPAPTYQWLRNEALIAGATQSTFTLRNATLADEGYYEVVASNSEGTVRSGACLVLIGASMDAPAFSLQPVASLSVGTEGTATLPGVTATAGADVPSRIVYLSLQSWAGGGDEGQIVGFVVSGSPSKSLLLRGVGPTLGSFGVADALVDPMLSLYAGSVLKVSNDDWSKAINAAEVAETSARLGAFSLPESGADAAMVTTLAPGAYTLRLNSKTSSAGVALAEIYDAEPGNLASLVNMSARTRVGTGGGAPEVRFVISGTTSKQVMIRAVGPTLSAFGVTDVLADPELKIFQEGVLLAANDNWLGDPMLSETFARIGAFALVDQGSRDAVLFMTLLPGAYSVVVSGVNGGTGIALVEVYDVP